MPATYEFDMTLRAEHVDFKRQFRLSEICRLFQQCCIKHTELLGMGRDKTLDKGLLWVVLSLHLKVHRLPVYDETIHVECYPGSMLHYFFPRQLLLKDKEGNVLVEGNSMWGLIDEKDRELVDPKEYGIIIAGEDRPDQLPPLMMIPMPMLSQSASFNATYSLCDINGHLNNASYIDLMMDLLPLEEISAKHPKELCVTFKKEVPLGEKLILKYGTNQGSYYFSSPNFNAKLIFG